MNLLAFGVVALVGRHRPALLLEDFRGLWHTEPLTAAALAFALLLPRGPAPRPARPARQGRRPPGARRRRRAGGWRSPWPVNVVLGLAY